jgi:hypothetical protein
MVEEDIRPALHFVGFRGDEHTAAVRTFGRPDFYHYWWDRRAMADVVEGVDTVVFANGAESKPKWDICWDDSSRF